MTSRRTKHAWLIAALLLAGCEQVGRLPASAEREEAADAAPQALASPSAIRGCGRHGAIVAEADKARPLPALTGRVVDMADLLPPPAERSLTDELAALEAETSDQFVVVTMPSLEAESINSLGLRLGNGWGIGQERLDNGVLLIVAPNERQVRIEVGCGLEGLLTDERAQQIIDDVLLPRFGEGHFAEGIRAGAARILAILRSSPHRPQPWSARSTS